MIIPIRCMTCGKVLGDSWKTFNKKVLERKIDEDFSYNKSVLYLKDTDIKKTIEGEVLDELNMRRYCCRRMFLSQAEILEKV